MSDKKPSPEMVGRQFIKKYYERLDSQPETMHRFYQEKSSMIYGEDSSAEVIVTGLANIKAKMAERSQRKWLLNLEKGSVDAQRSINGGVILLVTGTVTSNQNAQPRQFVQSFFLAEHVANNHAPSYYVLNDTFRIVDTPPLNGSSNQSAKEAISALFASDESILAPPGTEAPNPVVPDDGPKSATAEVEPGHPPPNGASDIQPTTAPASSDEKKTPEVTPQSQPPSAPPKKPFSWANMVKDNTNATPPPPPPSSSSSKALSAAKPAESSNQVRSRRAQGNAKQAAQGSKSPKQGETELERKTRKLNAVISPDDMPSTAIYVKGLETPISEELLKDTFIQFMTEPDREKLLIAEHHDRGYAFIDLGSQEAVARAVSTSLSQQGLTLNGNSLVVEPSKKPVRPSGVKAINERKNSGSLSPKLSSGGRKTRRGSGGAKGEK